jgi:Rrf2 family iron-sulfur cluster assembly transcriptional regulator
MQLLASEEYGLRCLLRVAALGDGEPVSIAAVAASEGLGTEYSAKLLRRLRLAGLVESVRGADGGYRLARPAREITVWSALQALGGEFFAPDFCACHPGRQRRCVRATDCSLRPLWQALQAGVRATLQGITLADLERDEGAMRIWIEEAGATDVGRHFIGL